jgi:calcineurin-like phosphoesterase family protein
LQLPLNKGLELVNLCHEPSLHDKNYFNLFGHIHKLCMIKQFGLNVGIDCHNFYPCDLDTIIFYKNAIENHYDKEVFL